VDVGQHFGVPVEGVAFADQAPADEDPVGSTVKGLFDEIWADFFCAYEANTAQARRIFTVQISHFGKAVFSAFLTKKARDRRLKRTPGCGRHPHDRSFTLLHELALSIA
jgi:hypothetical protein